MHGHGSVMPEGEWVVRSTVGGRKAIMGFGLGSYYDNPLTYHDHFTVTYHDHFTGDLSLSKVIEKTLTRVPRDVSKIELKHLEFSHANP